MEIHLLTSLEFSRVNVELKTRTALNQATGSSTTRQNTRQSIKLRGSTYRRGNTNKIIRIMSSEEGFKLKTTWNPSTRFKVHSNAHKSQYSKQTNTGNTMLIQKKK